MEAMGGGPSVASLVRPACGSSRHCAGLSRMGEYGAPSSSIQLARLRGGGHQLRPSFSFLQQSTQSRRREQSSVSSLQDHAPTLGRFRSTWGGHSGDPLVASAYTAYAYAYAAKNKIQQLAVVPPSPAPRLQLEGMGHLRGKRAKWVRTG